MVEITTVFFELLLLCPPSCLSTQSEMSGETITQEGFGKSQTQSLEQQGKHKHRREKTWEALTNTEFYYTKSCHLVFCLNL